MFDKNSKGSPLTYDFMIQDDNLGELHVESRQITSFEAIYANPFTEEEIANAIEQVKARNKATKEETGEIVLLSESALKRKAYNELLKDKKPSKKDVLNYIKYAKDPILAGCSLKWLRSMFFHISQEAMAEKIGVSRVYYTNLETGRNKISSTASSRIIELCEDIDNIEFDSGVQMVLPDEMIIGKDKKQPAFRMDPPIYTADGKRYETLKYAIAYENEWIPSLIVGVNDIVVYCPEITYGSDEDCFVMHDAINEQYFVGQIIVGTNDMGLPYVKIQKFASIMDTYEGKPPFEELSGEKGIECIGRIVEVRKRFKAYKGNISV